MKSFEVYRYRRISLRWTIEYVAERANVLPSHVQYFEEGKSIGRDYESKIKLAIDDGFRELNSIEHHKTRILELSYEIKFGEDNRETLQRIGHMNVVLGKLQREIVN